MTKCRIRKDRQAEWSWQPFGPAQDSAETFTTPGWHYRGFAVIPICEDCKERVQMGDGVRFEYRGVTYATVDGQPHETPRVVRPKGGQ